MAVFKSEKYLVYPLKFHTYPRLGTVALKQACTTYGLWAKCGPRRLLIWPAKPQILFILLLSLVKTPYECVKTY